MKRKLSVKQATVFRRLCYWANLADTGRNLHPYVFDDLHDETIEYEHELRRRLTANVSVDGESPHKY